MKTTEKILDEFSSLAELIQMFVKNPDGLAKQVSDLKASTLAHRDALGAHDTVDKARIYLVSIQDKERAASAILDGAQANADAIIKAADEKAANIKRDADNNHEASRRLQSETQALKDKAAREHDDREKSLVKMKQDLDARQSVLNRREMQVDEAEKALAEKKRRVDAALAG